jgi:DNA-binding NarL/FixJ family response regulator
MTFLIADDSDEKTAFLQKLAKQVWEGEILVATTSEASFAIIDAHPDIRAAFVDYYIPSTNGPAIIRYLREKIPSAHIVLVSSSSNPRNAAEAREAGADAVVCSSDHGDEVEKQLLDLLEEWK